MRGGRREEGSRRGRNTQADGRAGGGKGVGASVVRSFVGCDGYSCSTRPRATNGVTGVRTDEDRPAA